MGLSYYDALLPVREPGPSAPGLRHTLDSLRLPHRVLAAIRVPGGRIVLAFVSDSAELSRMVAANWAPAWPGQKPDATLYAMTGGAREYGLGEEWERARWWAREEKSMAVFRFGSYRLAKVCVRGICSAVGGDDVVFLHGCALSVDTGAGPHGVVVTGSSGAGKTTLVAGLLGHPEYPVTVLNDDWGPVALDSGSTSGTGEQMLHMKSASVLALRPDFFAGAPPGSYAPDVSEPDEKARVLVSPDAVYGRAWGTQAARVTHLAVVVREPPGWQPPRRKLEALRAIESEGEVGLVHHHEAFFNGSLILTSKADALREERRFARLLRRTTVAWINNCGPPGALVDRFLSAVGADR